MKITDEMVERAAHAMCVEGGFDPNERMPNDGPRWKYYAPNARSALTAALSAEQTRQGVEVKDWHRSDNAYGGVMLYSLREDGWRKGEHVMVNDVTIRVERAPRSETDIEPIVQRIRSALVDVPAVVPVGEQWCAYEDGRQHTSWYPDGYGDRAGWEALAKRNPAKYQVVTRDLFTSPPLSREGEDSAEVERLRDLLSRAEEYVIDGVTNAKAEAEMNAPYPARSARYDAALAEAHQLYADIQAAIAATRSGSATTAKGTGE